MPEHNRHEKRCGGGIGNATGCHWQAWDPRLPLPGRPGIRTRKQMPHLFRRMPVSASLPMSTPQPITIPTQANLAATKDPRTAEALNIATAGWQQMRDIALRYMALEAAAFRCAIEIPCLPCGWLSRVLVSLQGCNQDPAACMSCHASASSFRSGLPHGFLGPCFFATTPPPKHEPRPPPRSYISLDRTFGLSFGPSVTSGDIHTAQTLLADGMLQSVGTNYVD